MEASSYLVTNALTTEIQKLINTLLPAHQLAPIDGEIIDNPQDRYIRLQDWAFTQGFVMVKKSSQLERVVPHCIHHHDKSQDIRKTDKTDRKRA